MNRFYLCFLLCAFVVHSSFSQQRDLLWYNKPATKWTEALPVGNGILGAMIFGKPEDELLQLNEATFWSGGPVQDNVNPGASKYLSPVREALFKEDYQEANKLVRNIQGVYSQTYLPLADLSIKQNFGAAEYQKYTRDLSLTKSLATVNFMANGVSYKREIIATAPGKVIVVRLSASKPGQISFKAGLTSQVNYTLSADGMSGLLLKAKAPSQVDPNYVKYNA
ncbi:MAG: glycoside hydrolase family 95 protein, partial [Chitinophagaceae bacterium]